MGTDVKFILINAILILCSCGSVKINQCNLCNVGYLKIAENNPNDTNIKNALCTMSIRCINNVEFMEYSNELVFLFLEREANITVREISKLSTDMQDFIIDHVAHPINDGIDLNLIRMQFQILKGKNENENKVIKRILNSLN